MPTPFEDCMSFRLLDANTLPDRLAAVACDASGNEAIRGSPRRCLVTMRVPIPKNRLVALTLAGALLTAVVAGALAFPALGLAQSDDAGDEAGNTGSSAAPQAVSDAPTPNQHFTPAVLTQAGYVDEEHEEVDEHEEDDEAAKDGGE